MSAFENNKDLGNRLLNLANDALKYIWSFFEVQDIIMLSMTSKTIEDMCILINESINTSIHIREYGQYQIHQMSPSQRKKSLLRMMYLFPKIIKLKFNCTLRNKSEYLEINNKNCTGVEYYEDLTSVLYDSSSLQETLEELSIPIKSTYDLYNMHQLYNLKRLEIMYSLVSNVELKKEIRKLTNLTALSLYNCSSIVLCTNLFFVLDKYPNLTELNLDNCLNLFERSSNSNHRILNDVDHSIFRNLKVLSLSKTNINDYNFNVLIEKGLSNLVKLDLSHSKLSDNGLQLINKVRPLQILSLSGNYQNTINGLSNLLSLINLTSLDLSYCRIILQGLTLPNTSLFRSLINLKYINLEFCEITDEQLTLLEPPLGLNRISMKYCNAFHFDFLEKYYGLTYLDLSTTLQLSTIQFLKSLVNLTFLDISCTIYNRHRERLLEDSEMESMSTLTNLESLFIGGTFNIFSHHGCMIISTYLLKLRILSFKNSKGISIGALSQLKGLSSLTSLSLTACKFTDLGHSKLLTLSTLTNLKVLNLSLIRSRFVEFDLLTILPIHSLPHSLTKLDLAVCNLIDEHLIYLKNLTNLKKLDLEASPRISISGLSNLSKLVNLQNIRIYNNEENLNYLKTILPNVFIDC